MLLLAGCGLIGSSGTSSSASSSSSFSAYLNCLRQHGADIPAARPTTGAGGFGGSGGFDSTTFQQARQACAALRPSGGSGGGFGGFGGGGFATAFQAFRSCMAAHGEAIPTAQPTAPPSPGTDRFLNGLNPSNPKVAAALKACQSKLPSFPGAGASPPSAS